MESLAVSSNLCQGAIANQVGKRQRIVLRVLSFGLSLLSVTVESLRVPS